MNEITPETFPNYKSLNKVGHLPDFVKDPANYEKIERALLDTRFCGKTHSDPSQMFECKGCQNKTLERRELMEKFGFRDASDYLNWKKIHEEIRKKGLYTPDKGA